MCMTGTTESLGFDPCSKAGFVHVWKEETVYVPMRSTKPEGLSRRLGRNKESSLLSTRRE